MSFPKSATSSSKAAASFEFARASGQAGFSGQTSISNNAPQLFFTRRIGLNNAREAPIIAGGRLSGTLGKTAVGAMNMETGYESPTDIEPDNCGAPYAACTPRTNFTVLRARRDILRRSNIGVIFTNRSDSPTVATSNQAYGVDAAFSFFQNVTANAYYARSESQNRDGDEGSYQGKVDYSGDRWGARLDYLDVGANYYPEIGFVQRRGFGRTFAAGRFSPRMRRSKVVRRYLFEGAAEYVVNRDNDIESSRNTAHFLTEFQNSDQFVFDFNNNYELLLRPFVVSPGVAIPAGEYPFNNVTTSYAFGQQRRMSGTVALQAGQFYDGDIQSLTVSTARVALMKQFSLEPGLTLNNVKLPAGDFTNMLIRTRIDYGFSPLMFLSALSSTAPRSAPSAPTSGSGGSTALGVKCSWSILTSATPPARAIRG